MIASVMHAPLSEILAMKEHEAVAWFEACARFRNPLDAED